MIGEPALISGVAREPSAFACPCCGAQTETPVPAQGLLQKSRGHLAGGIIEALVQANGRGMSADALSDRIYQLRADYPDSAIENIHVTVCKLRKELPQYGWTITGGGRGVISNYKLTPIQTRVEAKGTA